MLYLDAIAHCHGPWTGSVVPKSIGLWSTCHVLNGGASSRRTKTDQHTQARHSCTFRNSIDSTY